MTSPSSDENTPVIKSRTGKFLQNVFDKKTARKETPTGELNDLLGELMQVVPDQNQWHDDDEESNWDDDFVEAPQPSFIISEPANQPIVAKDPVVETPKPTTPPPPPAASSAPTAIAATSAAIFDDVSKLLELDTDEAVAPTASTSTSDQQELSQVAPQPIALDPSQVIEPPAPVPNPPPAPRAMPKAEVSSNSEAMDVSIPRPKNIKFKPKDPNRDLEPAVAKADGKSEPIELNIKRPSSIKYKAKPPEDAPTGLPAKLLGMIKSIKLPGLPSVTIPQLQLPNAPNFKLPLGDNLQKIVTIVAAVFLSLLTAWAAINFWPRSVAAPVAIVQPTMPSVNPEAELIKAVQSRLQTLAGQYPAGLITNLELDAQRGLATITVGDLWRSLSATQQQQTAQSLWQQAVTYQMAKLEVRSATDQLLARSPVVGGEAIMVNN
jgi:hypothetical protein